MKGEKQRSRGRRFAGALVYLVVVVVASGALLELALVAIRQVPALSKLESVGPLARQLYFLDRWMIQFQGDASRYDEDLGYTLRPGEFVFRNTEFDTTYRVNRLGVRDDEASLHGPHIVVVGDSFAMGWGVEQDEAFPQVLETTTGLRVLNTAIASYGTVRQMRMLQRVDLESARWLVIQFCDNDFFENRRFVREGPDVAPISRARYEQTVRQHAESRKYFLGRYAWTLLRTRLRLGGERIGPGLDDTDPELRQEQVDNFLEVLSRSTVDLSNLQIIVFSLDSDNRDRRWFVERLRKTVGARDDLLASLRSMVILDMASNLGPDDFFQIDDHMNARGHRVVAETVRGVIEGGS